MLGTSEAAIFRRVIESEKSLLSAEAARSILAFDFTPADRERMHALALKNQAGALTAEEQQELDSYRRVGRFLDLLRSKARQSLKKLDPNG